MRNHVPLLRLRIDGSPHLTLSEFIFGEETQQCESPGDCGARADDAAQFEKEVRLVSKHAAPGSSAVVGRAGCEGKGRSPLAQYFGVERAGVRRWQATPLGRQNG